MLVRELRQLLEGYDDGSQVVIFRYDGYYDTSLIGLFRTCPLPSNRENQYGQPLSPDFLLIPYAPGEF